MRDYAFAVRCPQCGQDTDKSIVVLGEGISKADIKFRKGSLLIDMGGGDKIHSALPPGQDDPALFPLLDRIEFADGSRMTWDRTLKAKSMARSVRWA